MRNTTRLGAGAVSPSARRPRGRSASDRAKAARITSGQLLDQRVVGVGAAVPEELPGLSDLEDLVEVQVGDDERVLVAGADRQHLSPRVAEVALAVELAHVP